ncbi:MAG: hypothetical protein WC608_04200 [Parcubacteria group bacterium]
MGWYCSKRFKKDVKREKEEAEKIAKPEISFEEVDCPEGKKDLSTGQILKVKMLLGNKCNKAKGCKTSCGHKASGRN